MPLVSWLLSWLPWGCRSRNRELQELFQSGIGLHHAGMLRSDRNLTERLFSDGFIKVRDDGMTYNRFHV